MTNIENSPRGAMRRIAEAAKARADLPRFTFGWASALLAFSILILRGYDAAWFSIRVCAAAAALFLLGGVVSLVARIAALKQIETIDDGEIFDGRIPDPEHPEYQKKVAAFGLIYRRATGLGNRMLIAGASFLAISLMFVIAYHLVN